MNGYKCSANLLRPFFKEIPVVENDVRVFNPPMLVIDIRMQVNSELRAMTK
jgi:hypothetical protein